LKIKIDKPKMITRIVRMNFTEQGAKIFSELFEKHRVAMASVSGCLGLKLFCELAKPGSFATISKWESEDHLEAYRKSDLFNTIWQKIKPHFSEKAEAFSLVDLDDQ
jgi:quinol monooxygenase YgiN